MVIITRHPAVIATYERKLERLEESIAQDISDGESEHAAAIRDLVQAVTVSRPKRRPDAMEIEITGRLNVLLGENAFPNNAFPNGIGRVGSRIQSFVIYLWHYQLLPEDRLAELMTDLFGVKLVAAVPAQAGIARMSRTCAERLRGFADTVRGGRAGQAHGRDRLSYRRQDAMAACGVHRPTDLLLRLRQARAAVCWRMSPAGDFRQLLPTIIF